MVSSAASFHNKRGHYLYFKRADLSSPAGSIARFASTIPLMVVQTLRGLNTSPAICRQYRFIWVTSVARHEERAPARAMVLCVISRKTLHAGEAAAATAVAGSG